MVLFFVLGLDEERIDLKFFPKQGAETNIPQSKAVLWVLKKSDVEFFSSIWTTAGCDNLGNLIATRFNVQVEKNSWFEITQNRV